MNRITDNTHRTGPAVEAMYRFLLWLVPTVEKFPRSQKFLLGDRIQATAPATSAPRPARRRHTWIDAPTNLIRPTRHPESTPPAPRTE